MKFVGLMSLLTCSLIFNSCNVLVVLFSPAKQRTKDVTVIPKKSDFSYSRDLSSDFQFFDTIVSYTVVDSNYTHVDGTKFPVKESYVFFSSGQCYQMGPYDKDVIYFDENKFFGKSGYYYLYSDTIFAEIFGSHGLGHGYYYYQGILKENGVFQLDSEEWYYREPKRKRKYKLFPSEGEKNTIFELRYEKDTLTVFSIDPSKW